jgi:hypothetical protein
VEEKLSLTIEEKLNVYQSEQSRLFQENTRQSAEDFRELWKTDLAMLRSEEAVLREKERLALREDEVSYFATHSELVLNLWRCHFIQKKFRDYIKETIVGEISRFQAEALSVISEAQEELAKRYETMLKLVTSNSV